MTIVSIHTKKTIQSTERTEEIFNPYLEDGAGSSDVDQLLLALAKSGKTITINASDLNIDEDFKSKEKLSYYLYKKGFSIFTNSGSENPGIILFIRPDYANLKKYLYINYELLRLIQGNW